MLRAGPNLVALGKQRGSGGRITIGAALYRIYPIQQVVQTFRSTFALRHGLVGGGRSIQSHGDLLSWHLRLILYEYQVQSFVASPRGTSQARLFRPAVDFHHGSPLDEP